MLPLFGAVIGAVLGLIGPAWYVRPWPKSLATAAVCAVLTVGITTLLGLIQTLVTPDAVVSSCGAPHQGRGAG